MPQLVKLDSTKLEGFSALFHGGYAVGKTHFVGDALKYESQFGDVRFLNIAGEDGYASLAQFDLGDVIYTVDSTKDFEKTIADWSKLNLRAVGVDSLSHLARMVIAEKTGNKVPDKTDYPEIHFNMNNLIMTLRRAAFRLICVCPSDRSVEQISGDTLVTPDLPGRQAAGSAGWFDFVGYIKVVNAGPGKVNRSIVMGANSKFLVRQRGVKRAITQDIAIPENEGGYTNFINAVQKAKE